MEQWKDIFRAGNLGFCYPNDELVV